MSPHAAASDAVPIEPHHHETRPRSQPVRAGTRADRMLREVETTLPSLVAGVHPSIPSRLSAAIDDALRTIARLDEVHGEHLASLSTLLLRTESVASSKIEQIEASMADYARALKAAGQHGAGPRRL